MTKRTATDEIDACVLGHTMTFSSYMHDPARAGGGWVSPVGTLDERAMTASLRRLEASGYVEPADDWRPLSRGQRSRRYQITDAGRAEYRRRTAAADLTVDAARSMHAIDLQRRYGDVPLAQRQIALRRRGEDLARGVLRTLLGHGYSGTSGWHVIAFAAPCGHLGFVNTAAGHAVLTDVILDSAVIEALTVPAQGEGPKASGAAAWTSPDAGEATSSQAPRGWVQLVLDLRGEAEAIPCAAHICAWGLRTCYQGSRGAPGAQHLDAFDGSSRRNPWCRMDAREWPITREQRDRMYAAGEPILRAITLRLAEIAGMRAEIAAALDEPAGDVGPLASVGRVPLRLPTRNLDGAVRATGAYAWHGSGYDAPNAVRMAVGNSDDAVAAKALREAGITGLCVLAGDVDEDRLSGARYWDVCRRLLERILIQELTPAAEALWTALEPHAARNQHGEHGHLYLHQVQPLIAALAPKLAKMILERAVVPADAHDTIYAALYSGEYIELHAPITLPERKTA